MCTYLFTVVNFFIIVKSQQDHMDEMCSRAYKQKVENVIVKK